jgi:hypothetical protein
MTLRRVRFLRPQVCSVVKDAVQVVLQQPQTAEFLVGKLLRYFVLDEPAGQAELISPLAQQFRDGGLQIVRCCDNAQQPPVLFQTGCGPQTEITS